MIQILTLGVAVLAFMETKEHHEWLRDHYQG